MWIFLYLIFAANLEATPNVSPKFLTALQAKKKKGTCKFRVIKNAKKMSHGTVSWDLETMSWHFVYPKEEWILRDCILTKLSKGKQDKFRIPQYLSIFALPIEQWNENIEILEETNDGNIHIFSMKHNNVTYLWEYEMEPFRLRCLIVKSGSDHYEFAFFEE